MSDRIFGLIIALVAVGYIATATQIQTSFLMDPVGPKTFPILVGAVSLICALMMMLRPDPEPDWPAPLTLIRIAAAVVVLIAYAYALKPFGFLFPTALAAGILSYQISPKILAAVTTGIGLSLGLFVVFKYALGLSLFALPR